MAADPEAAAGTTESNKGLSRFQGGPKGKGWVPETTEPALQAGPENGASRTRTGGLLGAIRATESLELVPIGTAFGELRCGAGHSRLPTFAGNSRELRPGKQRCGLNARRISTRSRAIHSSPIRVCAADEATFATAPFRALQHSSSGCLECSWQAKGAAASSDRCGSSRAARTTRKEERGSAARYGPANPEPGSPKGSLSQRAVTAVSRITRSVLSTSTVTPSGKVGSGSV